MKTALPTELKFPTQIGKRQSASIKQLVEKMGQHIKKSAEKLAELEVKQQELLEKINCTIIELVIPAVLRSAAYRKKTRKKEEW